MKKYASLLLFALLINSCDDGDLTVETINFDDVSIQSCNSDPFVNTLFYKLKSQESLVTELPANIIKNDATTTPLTYNIDSGGNGQYRLLYRAYDGEVATPNICASIRPKTPNVTEEWIATSGVITINSTQIEETDVTTGSSKITGYNHSIEISNVTFLKPSGEQVMAEIAFGDYKTTITPVVVDFTDDEDAKYCKEAKKIYNENAISSLVIENIDASLIVNQATPVDSPRKSLINQTATTNNVFYRTYNSTLPADTSIYFCTTQTPSTPTVIDNWYGKNGVQDVSGIIEVTTTEETNVFRHKVVLRNAVLQKGNSTFKLGTTFSLGSFTTNK